MLIKKSFINLKYENFNIVKYNIIYTVPFSKFELLVNENQAPNFSMQTGTNSM